MTMTMMKRLLGAVLFAVAVLAAPLASAETFQQGASWQACFVPGDDCEGLIVSEIAHAKHTVRIQAYNFTSAPIAGALADDEKRGVDVQAVLDKSQRTERYSGATFLRNSGIPVSIDDVSGIAHNKVIIIDDDTVITGSFNFTKSAQQHNAENVLVVHGDHALVARYLDNWMSRHAVSTPF
jgi:phosphatidylserine/phosphatidylglycerophosphate/cardiolipin synthase-like enzyme